VLDKYKLVPLVCVVSVGLAQQPANQNILLIHDFENRVEEYVKLHKTAGSGIPALKPADSASVIAHHERALGDKIRAARSSAKQGDIFTPGVVMEFRRLIGIAMQGSEAAHVRQSLHRAEPVVLRLRVNDAYPANVPLQSTPPSLLLNLPRLPKELEYHIVGHSLIILDVEANLVVDLIDNAIP
jgi:hypothetical protein